MLLFKSRHEVLNRDAFFRDGLRHRFPPGMPKPHDAINERGKRQRNIPSLGDLGGVREEEGAVHNEEAPRHDSAQQQTPTQVFTHGHVEKHRCHQHGCRDRNTVGRREIIRFSENQRQADGHDHQEPVHGADIDLPVSERGRLGDAKAGQPAKLHRLPGHGEGARDDGLARDDGRNGGEDDKGRKQACGQSA